MSDIELKLATERDLGVLDNLMQLYTHDFSEQWAGTDRGELGPDGRFDPYPFVDLGYWRDPERVAFLITRQDRLIGFVLVNAHSHTGLPMDRAIAEFFVVRKHRRSGAGQAAAHAVLARWPGRWEAAVARRNLGALAFWRRAVAACPAVREIEEVDMANDLWNGPVLRFRVGPEAAAI